MLLNVSLHKPRPAAGSTRMYLGEVKNNNVNMFTKSYKTHLFLYSNHDLP